MIFCSASCHVPPPHGEEGAGVVVELVLTHSLCNFSIISLPKKFSDKPFEITRLPPKGSFGPIFKAENFTA